MKLELEEGGWAGGCMPAGGRHRSGRRRWIQFPQGNRRLQREDVSRGGECEYMGRGCGCERRRRRGREVNLLALLFTPKGGSKVQDNPIDQPSPPRLTWRDDETNLKHSTQLYCSLGFLFRVG